MHNIINIIKLYWLDLIIGAVLLYIDIRLFLFFIFMQLLIVRSSILSLMNDYIRAVLLNQNDNRMRLRALIRKTKVTHKEIETIIEEAASDMSADHYDLFRDSIRKDIK